jgi:hypothetical protein
LVDRRLVELVETSDLDKLDHPITRSPDHPITRSPEGSITLRLDHPKA